MVKTFGTLFSGCGGADEGLQDAGLDPVYAVEWNKGALDILTANHEIPHAIYGDVNEVDYSQLPGVDLLWASPVCCNFSGANFKRKENPSDMGSAQAIVRAAQFAKSIVIENVPAYQTSESFAALAHSLYTTGFKSNINLVLEATEFGNPSRRRRFYSVFSRGELPVDATALMEARKPRRNWDEIINDFTLAPERWQSTNLTSKQSYSIEEYQRNDAITSNFVIERRGYYGLPKITLADSVFPCIKSHVGHDGKTKKVGFGKIGSYAAPYTYVINKAGSFYPYDIPISKIGVLNGFPSNYVWGKNKAQAFAAIGNAVVPRMAEAIAEFLL